MADRPQVPADLIRRLPATFGPALNDQFRQWDYLFPAERRQLQAQLDWLARLPGDEFGRLFAPLFEIEGRMALPHWDSNTAGLNVRDVGILARSPLYPQWRGEVERVFSRIDASAEQPGELQNVRRLVVCTLPPGVLPQDRPLWPDLAANGAWLALDRPFGEILPAFVAALAKRPCPMSLEEDERTWVIECDSRFSDLSGAIVLSWAALAALRREFLKRLNAVHRDLRSVDQTSEDLKRTDIGRLVGPAIAANPRVREFLRSVLLSGNGSLVFDNSFVQWTASEALRRAQPQALVAAFGFRQKLKPFSSVVLFEDQNRSNPAPDEDDPAGSLVDALMLSKYVYLSVQRVVRHPERTLTIMSASGLNRVLVAGPGVPALPHSPASPEDLTAFALRWLSSAS
jgi:hypothetical protein